MYQYYNTLKKLADDNKDERMPCTSLYQIQQWYSIILYGSYHEVRIFCKDLNWLNTPVLIQMLSGFLYIPDTYVKILLKENCDISCINSLNYDNLQVKIATGSYATPEAKEFAVVDDRCFRFEARLDFGIINFNSYNESQKLIEAFDQAFSMGSYVQF